MGDFPSIETTFRGQSYKSSLYLSLSELRSSTALLAGEDPSPPCTPPASLHSPTYSLGMKRPMTSNEAVDVITLDESASSDSDMEDISKSGIKQSPDDTAVDNSYDDITPEDALARRAEMYQEYMKQIPIPKHRGSVIPFTTWTGLGKSMKQLYKQPLHYLTNRLLKQWDQSRVGSEDEYTPLDIIMHPSKAEATVWLVEEIHRRTSSHYHIAKFWLSDPMYHCCVDSIFPQLGSSS